MLASGVLLGVQHGAEVFPSVTVLRCLVALEIAQNMLFVLWSDVRDKLSWRPSLSVFFDLFPLFRQHNLVVMHWGICRDGVLSAVFSEARVDAIDGVGVD